MEITLEDKHRNVMEVALETWGHEAQMLVAIEEMAELTKALLKTLRTHNTGTKEAVIDEIADVLIMAKQLALMYGESEVEKQMGVKLERLAKRLEVANQPTSGEREG